MLPHASGTSRKPTAEIFQSEALNSVPLAGSPGAVCSPSPDPAVGSQAVLSCWHAAFSPGHASLCEGLGPVMAALDQQL